MSNDTFGEVSNFKFYPNPVENVLNIKSQNTIDSVSVFNMLGQNVMTLAPNAISEKIDMTELRDGTYFVKVVSGNSVKRTKILKR